MQGEHDGVAEALARGEIESANLDEPHRRLMDFVALLTQHAYRNDRETVQQLRDAGWTDAQIAETVYVTAMFAFFNRVADAFGLTDPGYREMADRGEQPPRPAERSKPN